VWPHDHPATTEVAAHHSAPSSAALAEGSRADCIQTISPRVQVYLTEELCQVADVKARQESK